MARKSQKPKTQKKGQKSTADNSLRIIGGEWRSRKLQFPDANGLRPTSGKIRETLFNWLGHKVLGISVLDMFAGSGALGFEVLSRGAAAVVMVEKDRKAAEQLKQNCKLLQAAQAQVINADALAWCSNISESFDLVFVDPPFGAELGRKCLEICKSGLVNLDGLVYLETAKSQQVDVPEEFEVLKDKSSGNVRYQLLQRLR